jgi:hypothetical protein
MVACMGVRVHLAVVVDRVSDAAWHGIYEKARRVAKHWTPRPLSIAWRQIGAVRVAQYVLDIEAADGLHLVGDAETFTTAESFVFPARLGRGAAGRGGSQATSHDDVLVAIARRHAPKVAGRLRWCDLFGEKTQGLPYHTLLVALGLLVESSLPGTAVVFGDISLHDGEEAQRGVASILGKDLELPVVVDVERMRRRLAASLNADAVDQAIRELGPPDPHFEAIVGDLLGQLRSSPDARVRHELEHVVRSCPDPNILATGTRLLLHRLVEAIRSNMVRGEICQRVEQWGVARTREELAHRTLMSGMRLTSMAWDAIEAADLDELAFLCGAICMDTTRLEVHQAVRAVLENRALRRAGRDAGAQRSRPVVRAERGLATARPAPRSTLPRRRRPRARGVGTGEPRAPRSRARLAVG